MPQAAAGIQPTSMQQSLGREMGYFRHTGDERKEGQGELGQLEAAEGGGDQHKVLGAGAS